MAIVFLRELDATKINFSYNNNIVRFYTDSGVVPVNATISVGSQIVTLYPDPNGIFYYNFKSLVSNIFNSDNFADDLVTDLSTSFVYDWFDKISFINDMTITINLSNDTTETDTRSILWLSGYVNLTDSSFVIPNDISNVRILQKENGSTYSLNYWYGYPFDLCYFKRTTENTDIENLNNSSSYSFDNVNASIERLVFSDGRTTPNIESVLPLENGINILQFTGSENNIDLYLNKITDYCTDGIYIKWINSLGGWNYWLFSKGQTQTKTKSLGSLNNDFENLEDTLSPLVSLGKTSANTIKVQQKRVNESDKILLTDLLDSAKVYLFKGTPFQENTYLDWVEVNLTNGSYTIENPKSNLYQFDFTLELPENVTRTL